MMAEVAGSDRAPRSRLRATLAYLRLFAGLHPNARRLLLGNLCINVGLGVFGVVFNLYLVALGHTVGYVGLVAAATTVGQAAIALLVGLSLRRYGEREVLMVGAGSMALFSGVAVLVTNPIVIVVAAALSGAAFSTATIPALPYMMRYVTARQRTHLFSAYFASTTVGTMIGSLLSGVVPVLGAALTRSRGQGQGQGHAMAMVLEDRVGLMVGVLVTAVGVLCFGAMRAGPPPPGDMDHAPHPSARRPAARDARRDVLVMLVATVLIALAMGATMPFFNVYFATRLHAGTGTIGGIFAVSGLSCAVAAFLAPAIGRWGRLPGFNATRILTVPAFALFWLHPGLGLATLAYIARNVLGTMSGALENTYAMEILPAKLRGMVSGWRTLAFNGAWSLGSLAAGVIVARADYDAIFIGAAILTLAGSAVYYGYFARSMGDGR